MRKPVTRRLLCLTAVLVLLFSLLPAAFADGGDLSVTNPDTGYRAVILDDLGLLTDDEREALLQDMLAVTEYGNVAFWSTRAVTSDVVEQARLKRRELFGLTSATIFVVNMSIRKHTIQSYGAIEDVVSTGRANTITNNMRNYLTREEYYEGARIVYEQICTLMQKGRIPQPMKYLSNGCIALLAALMLLLRVVIRYSSTLRRPEVIRTAGELRITNYDRRKTGRKRTYSPRQRDHDSGCGGSSCSSCGGGGSSCSSCGSGGSSSF